MEESFIPRGTSHPMTLYDCPPFQGTVQLPILRKLAASRVALLKLLERHNTEGKAEKEILKHLADYGLLWNPVESLDSKLLAKTTDLIEKEQSKICQNDLISHFMLKIAFSQDRDRQEWFIRYECRLMQLKLRELKRADGKDANSKKNPYLDGMRKTTQEPPIETVLKRFDIHFEKFYKSPQTLEMWNLATEFRSEDMGNNEDIQNYDFLYLVSFHPYATNLIKRRRVFVKAGIAFVPSSDIDQVILSRFKRSLQQSFKLLGTRSNQVQKLIFEDERIADFTLALPKAHVGPDYTMGVAENDVDRLTPAIINKIYAKSFPPCMRKLYAASIKNHHLKHWGRQQLWMFLKGAGMNLDEQLDLHRRIWADPSKFDKEHRYNLRYMYGQEGKRTNFTPYNCAGITLGSLPLPGAGDFHGCPFKCLSEKPLEKLMQDYGVFGHNLSGIMDSAKSKQPTLACVGYFKAIHPGSTADGVGNHPNQFYKESSAYLRRTTKK